MESLLRELQSPDNAVRNAAEKRFQQALSQNVRQAMNELLQAVLVCQDMQVCHAGAVLFRGQVIKAKTGKAWWATLSDSEKSDLRRVLLERLSSAPSVPLRRAVGEIVAEIATMSMSNGTDEWPDLVQKLAGMAVSANDNGNLSLAALSTLQALVHSCPGRVEDGSTLPSLMELLCGVMQQPPCGNNEARTAAVSTASTLFALLDDEDEETMRYVPALRAMLNAVQSLGQSEKLLLQWCEAVIESVQAQPMLVKASGVAKVLTETMLSIAGNKSGGHSEDVRKQALEVVVSMVIEMPGDIKGEEELVRSLLKVCIMFMLELEDDVDDLEDEQMEGAAEEGNLLDAGARATHILCESLGEKCTLPILFPMVEELLCSSSWRNHRAGLLALTRATYCGGVLMYDHLEFILKRMLPFVVRDESPIKVRLLGLDTLCAMFLCFGDVTTMFQATMVEGEPGNAAMERKSFQVLFREPLLGALSTLLNEPTENSVGQWALKSKAALSVAYFSYSFTDGEGFEVLQSHVDEILGKLYRLMEVSGAIQAQRQSQHGLGYVPNAVDTSYVQTSALSAVGSVASALGEHFAPYYDKFMPMAEAIYQRQEQVVATQKQQQQQQQPGSASAGEASKWTEKQAVLRGAALECISNIGAASGKDKFSPDAARLLGMIVQYIDNLWDLGESDRNQQVANLASTICVSMETVDQAVLGKLIEKFLQWANVEVHQVLAEEEVERQLEENEFDEDDDRQYIQVGEGEILCINTFQVKERESAVRVLQEMIVGLGEAIVPWVQPLAEHMLDHTRVNSYFTTPDLQLCAASSLSKIMETLSTHLRRQQLAGTLQQEAVAFAQHVFDSSIQNFLETIVSSFKAAEEEDQEAMQGLKMGKEFDEEEDQDALVLTTISNQVTRIMRAAFESGGLTDSDVDKMLSPDYQRSKFPPLFGVPEQKAGATLLELATVMQESCKRPRGYPWWRDVHNHEVMDAMSEATGLVVKTHGAATLGVFGRVILPIAFSQLDAPLGKGPKEVTPPLKAQGLFFLDDVIEYGQPAAAELVPRSIEYMLTHASAANFVLRQAALFGLGVCAEHGGDKFAPFLERTVAALVAAIETPGSREGEGACATDNAISALFKCIYFHKCYDGIPKLISYLPCKVDALEARTVHYRLYKVLASRDPAFMPHAEQIAAKLLEAHQSHQGWEAKKGEFDEDSAILTKETRAWLVANLPGANQVQRPSSK